MNSIQYDKYSGNSILSAYSNTIFFQIYPNLPGMVPGDDKIVYVHLGEKIKQARTQKKLSLRELAAICDVEHNTIHEIERGTLNFRFSTIIKISKGLAIPLHELLNPH